MAAGFSGDEVAKAVLMRRLMADVVLAEPRYTELNRSEALRLGVGPWTEIIELLYGPEPVDPVVEFGKCSSRFARRRQVVETYRSVSPAGDLRKL